MMMLSKQLRLECAVWILCAYLFAFMQPTILHSVHAATHLYSVAETKASHSSSDHVHAYNTHEHGDVLEILLQMLFDEDSYSTGSATVVQTTILSGHLVTSDSASSPGEKDFSYRKPVSQSEPCSLVQRPFIPPPQLLTA